MGIMDVLETLSGPEYDEPAPVQTEEAEQILEEMAVEQEAMQLLDQETAGQPEPEKQQEDLPEAEPQLPEIPELLEQLKGKRRLRPETVLGGIAAFAGVLVLVLLILCAPFFGESEDPEALQQFHQDNFEPLQVTERLEDPQEDPGEQTQPEKPTIPPDRALYDQYDFQYDRHNYLKLQHVKSYAGVDVSAYQGVIDWKRVRSSGIDFAMIRLGYRGYESGKLVEDDYAKENLVGARDAGLRVGAYFFSQALNIKEVDQEIEFMLEILGERYLDMPIVLDWEIPASSARTARMDAETLTSLQKHFCDTMTEKGYKPMIYFNWHQSENLYYLSELEDYPFWLALYQDRMTYPWKVEMWQYTASGTVPGINGAVDLNVYMPD